MLKKITTIVLILVSLSSITYSQTVDELLNSAQKEMDNWNFDKAIEFCNKAAELEPSSAKVFFLRATAYNENGSPENAIKDYTKALELKCNKENEIYYNRGNAYAYVQDYENAVNDFTKYLELTPDDAYAYSMRADSKYQLGDYKGAIEDYTKAIELDPNYEEIYETYYQRAYAYSDNKEYDKAIADFEKVLELNPNHRMAPYRILRVKVKSGKYDEAISECTEKIAANDKDIEAYGIRSEAYIGKGDFDLAIKDLDYVINLYPIHETYYLRGIAYSKMNEPEKALADFQKALELEPNFEKAKIEIEKLK